VPVADLYTPAVGKFKLKAGFDPGELDGDSLTPTLSFGVTIGDEQFPDIFDIGVSDWKHVKDKEWNFRQACEE